MNQGLPLSACLCLLSALLVTACSGSIEAVDANRTTSATGGSGGSSGVVGAGGNTAATGTGQAGGANATTGTSVATGTTGITTGTSGTSSTSGTSGAGGQGGTAAEGGTEPAEAGDRADAAVDAANDRTAVGGDAAVQDAGPAIDYSMWQLQLPTGSGTSPNTVSPSQLPTYSSIYFYKADDGGQIFMSPATGVTTANSTRCRTEFRESKANGSAASWSAAGTNLMTVTGKVIKGSGITIAQVFNGGDGITLGELQYSPNGFNLFYEEARGAGQTTRLGNPMALDTMYTFTMELSKNVLIVTLNGKEVYRHTPGAGVLGSSFYFKVGNYDQTTSAGTPGTTAHSIVEVYSIAVLHQ